MLLPALQHKADLLVSAADPIDTERRKLLSELATYIRLRHKLGQPVHLIFICTHNSRRSHLAQAWAQAAAAYYGLSNIHCYSGGTEVTAFNPNAVRALSDSGFSIQQFTAGDNPTYKIIAGEDVSWNAYSKVYDDPSHPATAFAAIMTCSEADAACPAVAGADARFPVRYNDPKVADGTPQETATYAARADEIGREMLFVMKGVVTGI
jgi:protein-tyrosine-phosphatase